MDAIYFLLPPFVMCLLLVGIHCYLGLHVLKRDVIFIDLSLAQVAGLGATVSLLFGFEHHSSATYFISLGHTLVVAFLFSWARKFHKIISQEVLIGITYALASALVILVVNNLSHGAEHIKEILVGNILWVSWDDVLKTGIIYFFVSLIHYIFRHKLLAVSFGDHIEHSRFWDFIFFSLFGVVITSSVGVAGILLVFSFLIVPALTSSIFFKTIRSRLLFGWLFGLFISLIGMGVSYKFDLPAGATLVVCFASIPLLMLPFLGFLYVKKK